MTSETAVVGPIERWVEALSSGERSVYVDQLQMCVASVDECGCDVMTFAREADARQQLLVDALKAIQYQSHQQREWVPCPVCRKAVDADAIYTQRIRKLADEALKSVEGAA